MTDRKMLTLRELTLECSALREDIRRIRDDMAALRREVREAIDEFPTAEEFFEDFDPSEYDGFKQLEDRVERVERAVGLPTPEEEARQAAEELAPLVCEKPR